MICTATRSAGLFPNQAHPVRIGGWHGTGPCGQNQPKPVRLRRERRAIGHGPERCPTSLAQAPFGAHAPVKVGSAAMPAPFRIGAGRYLRKGSQRRGPVSLPLSVPGDCESLPRGASPSLGRQDSPLSQGGQPKVRRPRRSGNPVDKGRVERVPGRAAGERVMRRRRVGYLPFRLQRPKVHCQFCEPASPFPPPPC